MVAQKVMPLAHGVKSHDLSFFHEIKPEKTDSHSCPLISNMSVYPHTCTNKFSRFLNKKMPIFKKILKNTSTYIIQSPYNTTNR